MTARLVSAAVVLPVLFLFIWAGLPWLSVLVAAAAAVGAFELYQMFRRDGSRHIFVVTAAWAAAMVAGGHMIAVGVPVLVSLLPVVAGGALVSAAVVLASGRGRFDLASWRVSAGAALYVGGLLLHLPLLRGLDDGFAWVFFVLFLTFTADTFAFLVGRAVGRRQLAPSTSPGKTWEGAIGGLVGSIGAGAGLLYALDLDASLAQALVLGAVAGVAGQAGDLVESRLKRMAGVKDSGSMIPGHGGALDRLDSMSVNFGVLYYLVWLWVR